MPVMGILDRSIDERRGKSPHLPPDLESQKGKKICSEFEQQPIYFQPKQHICATSLGAPSFDLSDAYRGRESGGKEIKLLRELLARPQLRSPRAQFFSTHGKGSLPSCSILAKMMN